MKAVMLSIRPEWCRKIISGEKTVELRKSFPTADKVKTPFKCYIYCTQGTGANTLNIPIRFERIRDDYVNSGSMQSLNCPIGNGKVIGEFMCDALYWAVSHPQTFAGHPCFHRAAIESACVTMAQAQDYSKGKNVYGWHISDLVIYDTPKAVYEFFVKCNENCEDCDWWERVKVNADEFDMDCTSPLYGYKPLKRPPQSWCYVED